jgi:hypothetical protein
VDISSGGAIHLIPPPPSRLFTPSYGNEKPPSVRRSLHTCEGPEALYERAERLLPDMICEAIKEEMASQGVTVEDLREVLRKKENPPGSGSREGGRNRQEDRCQRRARHQGVSTLASSPIALEESETAALARRSKGRGTIST